MHIACHGKSHENPSNQANNSYQEDIVVERFLFAPLSTDQHPAYLLCIKGILQPGYRDYFI